VYELVPIQGPQPPEAFAALSALEGLDVKVHHVVRLEGICRLEPLVTHGARERPIVRVCESVLKQVRPPIESPATNGTRERQLDCVHVLVFF